MSSPRSLLQFAVVSAIVKLRVIGDCRIKIPDVQSQIVVADHLVARLLVDLNVVVELLIDLGLDLWLRQVRLELLVVGAVSVHL